MYKITLVLLLLIGIVGSVKGQDDQDKELKKYAIEFGFSLFTHPDYEAKAGEMGLYYKNMVGSNMTFNILRKNSDFHSVGYHYIGIDLINPSFELELHGEELLENCGSSTNIQLLYQYNYKLLKKRSREVQNYIGINLIPIYHKCTRLSETPYLDFGASEEESFLSKGLLSQVSISTDFSFDNNYYFIISTNLNLIAFLDEEYNWNNYTYGVGLPNIYTIGSQKNRNLFSLGYFNSKGFFESVRVNVRYEF